MPVVIIDGSPPDVFSVHAEAWRDFALHAPVDADLVAPNGKVAGVLTGLRHTRHEAVVIADDDVRYDEASLVAVVRALETAHVVRPQNYFDPLPWHAIWDTGRILLNRSLDGDWPGTLAVRHSALRATGGYAGDVLFENLELVRTRGRRRRTPADRTRHSSCVACHRTAATSGHSALGRRTMSSARPRRLAGQLAVLPALALVLGARRISPILAAIALIVVNG
jgi:hypothetical protein